MFGFGLFEPVDTPGLELWLRSQRHIVYLQELYEQIKDFSGCNTELHVGHINWLGLHSKELSNSPAACVINVETPISTVYRYPLNTL